MQPTFNLITVRCIQHSFLEIRFSSLKSSWMLVQRIFHCLSKSHPSCIWISQIENACEIEEKIRRGWEWKLEERMKNIEKEDLKKKNLRFQILNHNTKRWVQLEHYLSWSTWCDNSGSMALSSGAVEKQLWVRRFGAMKEQRNKAKERQGREEIMIQRFHSWNVCSKICISFK